MGGRGLATPSYPIRLQQLNIRLPARLLHVLRPQARLDLAHMRLAQQVDAHAALPDAAAHRLGQLAIEQRLLEWQLRALLAAARLHGMKAIAPYAGRSVGNAP